MNVMLLRYSTKIIERRDTLEKTNPRLDEFYHDLLHGKPEHNALWKLIREISLLIVISVTEHGN